MIKKFLRSLLIATVLIPSFVLGAVPVGWSAPAATTGWVVPNLVNGNSQAINALNGIFTNASSTFAGPFKFPNLAQGFLYTGTGGRVNSIASSSIQISWFNNDSGFITGGGFAANSIITTNNTGFLIATGSQLTTGNLLSTSTTATSTFRGPLHLGTSAIRDNFLQIDCLRNYPASQSVGGCVNINNTLNSGPAQNIFSSFGAGATAPQFKVRNDNSAYDQEMVTFQSLSATRSTLGVEGSSTAQAVVKVAHFGNGADGNVALFSGDLEGSGTAAQGYFLTSTQGGTTGKLAQFKNNLLAFGGADAQVNLFDITGEGRVGLASSTPWANLSINPTAGYPASGQPAFVIGSSTATVFSITPFGTNLLTLSTTSGNALVTSGTGFGTTTVSGFAISGSATSTSNVGFNLTGGCFAISGICIGSGSGSSSVGPVNVLQASDGSGGFIATGTPNLTVGFLTATTSTGSGTTTVKSFAIIPNGNTSNSVSIGGAGRLDNTLNAGAGFVFYTNHGSGATGRLGVFNCAGVGFDQDCVVMQGLAQGTNNTVLNVQASSTGKGGIKCEEKGYGYANASCLSIDVQGNSAMNLFLNTTGRGTGNLITGHNPTGGVDVFQLQSFDGGGKMALASDTPFSTFSIGNLGTETFGIATSTNGCASFTNGQLWITGSACGGSGSSAPNVTYNTIGSTIYYNASSTATDNKSWYFGNGFVSNASSTVAALFRAVAIGLGKAPSTSVRNEALTDGTYTTGNRVEGDTSSRIALSSFVTSDSQVRFSIQTGGIHAWGDGTTVATNDTNLYRGSQFHLATDRYLGIATTTGLAQFTVSTTTGFQFGISASGNQPIWVMRNVTGNFFLSTTTLDGTATTSTAALSISRDGIYQISTTTAGCLNTTVTGVLYSATCASGSGTVTSVVAGAGFQNQGLNITTTGTLVGAFATSATPVLGNLPYYTGVGDATNPAKFGTVATSSLAVGASLSSSGTLGAQVGGTASSLSINLANTNTWTVLQNFNYSSSTIYSSFQTSSSTDDYIGTLHLPNLTQGALYVGSSNLAKTVATSTITVSTGLSYSGTMGQLLGGSSGNLTVNATQNITNLSNLTTDGVVYTSGGNGTLNVDSGALDIARGGTNATSFSPNVLIGFNGTSMIATGTPQLTIGNLLSTTTNLSSFAGAVGIGSSTPWALLAVASTTPDYKTPLFSVATSTDAIGNLFNVQATSTTLALGSVATTLGLTQDTGVRIGVGTINYHLFGGLLDHFVVRGRINTEGWNNANCDIGSGLGNGTTASNICASFNIGTAQVAASSFANGNGGSNSGYAFGSVSVPVATAASGGTAYVFGETSGGAGWMSVATDTPVMEVNARPRDPTATTSTYYIGFDSNTKTGTMVVTTPTDGCYFTASTTQANWRAIARKASAETNADTGVASSTNVTAQGGFRKFRIEADNDSCSFYIQTTESASLSKVAEITTNVPNTVGLHANVWVAGGTGAAQGKTLNLDFNHFRVWWRDFLPSL